MFGTSHPSIYFSNSEMGNPNDDYEYFLANHVFWDFMDNLRSQTGEIVISSGYRSPSYNRSLVDEHGRRIAHDNSLHQYGAGTDGTKFGPNYWVNMTESQKDELFVQIGVAATVMQGTYGDRFYIEAKEKSDHLHFELMDYCHFDDNWL